MKNKDLKNLKEELNKISLSSQEKLDIKHILKTHMENSVRGGTLARLKSQGRQNH